MTGIGPGSLRSARSRDSRRSTKCCASLVVTSGFVKNGNVSSLSAGRPQRNICTAATILRQAMHETVVITKVATIRLVQGLDAVVAACATAQHCRATHSTATHGKRSGVCVTLACLQSVALTRCISEFGFHGGGCSYNNHMHRAMQSATKSLRCQLVQ